MWSFTQIVSQRERPRPLGRLTIFDEHRRDSAGFSPDSLSPDRRGRPDVSPFKPLASIAPRVRRALRCPGKEHAHVIAGSPQDTCHDRSLTFHPVKERPAFARNEAVVAVDGADAVERRTTPGKRRKALGLRYYPVNRFERRPRTSELMRDIRGDTLEVIEGSRREGGLSHRATPSRTHERRPHRYRPARRRTDGPPRAG